MKILETQKQFIKEEEGILVENAVETYNINFYSDMSLSSRMEFPQYELFFIAQGAFGWRSVLKLYYRGLELSPGSKENNETFILSLLNDLKKGRYETKMKTLFKERLNNEEFKNIESVLSKKNIKIKYLESEISNLKKEVDQLTDNDQSKLNMKLQKENTKLKEKLSEIKKLMK